ncbi:MAG: cytidylate kinase-like family protein [Desulfobacterales bacterium]|jgi:cytidylate kinase
MKSIPRIIEEQVQRWQIMQKEGKEEKKGVSIITISREPGSGGRIVATRLAEKLGIAIFHQEVINEMAKSADVSEKLVETLDERGLSTLEHWISSLVHERHLWPDRYMQHLMKVVGTIGKHGRAVVVGRGANFILPPEKRFSVRIVAPQAWRIDNVAKEFDISSEDAKRRVMRTDSDRRAFIRKYFNADIADPINYDLVVNTATLSVGDAVKVISSALGLVECVFVGS